MKKLAMLLSFALILGVVTANAQVPAKAVKKTAPKTEVVKKDAKDAKAAPAAKKVVKKDAKAAPATKKVVKKKAAPVKK